VRETGWKRRRSGSRHDNRRAASATGPRRILGGRRPLTLAEDQALLTVSSFEELAAALRTAPDGAEIGLAAPVYRITESLAVARQLTLRGCNQNDPPLLIFADGRCDLSVTSNGCRLEHLAFTARGHRAIALLRVAADACRLLSLTLLGAQGSGLRLEHCHDTSVHELVAQDLGQEAVVALGCTGLNLSLRGQDLGQRAAASAIRLIDCRSFQVEAEIAGVSGSAVAIEEAEGQPGPVAGIVGLRARGMQRALSVLGRRDAPASGLSARIHGHDWSDVGVLLSNAEDVTLHLAMPDVDAMPAVRINGGFGLRRSTVVLASLNADESAPPPTGLVVGHNEPSYGNAIRMRRDVFEQNVRPATCLPRALRQRLQDEVEPDFLTYEQDGRCSLCGWVGRFRRTHRSERETLACGACRATLRYRGQAEVICGLVDAGRYATLADLAASGALSGLAIYEPGTSGPLRPWLSQAGRYVQSIYQPNLPSGTLRADGHVCQDLMGTTFPDASFDFIVTSDIFEHVRKPFVAFAEIRRILRPGGTHLWTVPIGLPPPAETRARVDTSGREDRMLLEPIYHGSGSDGLSLVYTDFGRDIGRLLAGIGLPTRAVRHVVGEDRHVAGVTFVSVRPDEEPAAS
jgi:SAM-dependent methyltransferase